jgi:molybdopterin synthase catalytic subunit
MPWTSYEVATISVRLARICAEPVSVHDCLAAVADPSAGGVGSFLGVVRNRDDGRSVTSLEYEAHPSAEATLRSVCEKFATEDVVAVAAVHRSGTLSVGETAVVVAVSAVHRGEALRVTAALIDAIKAEVPIWKHQFYEDGSDDWTGCA